MVLKRLIGLAFAAALTFSTAAADIVVRIRPPRAVSERRTRPPSRNHVWVSGYHHWDGNAYAWSPGRWEQRPRLACPLGSASLDAPKGRLGFRGGALALGALSASQANSTCR